MAGRKFFLDLLPDEERICYETQYAPQLQVTGFVRELATEMVAATNRAKSDFLVNWNHEIRAPMNGAIGFANLLERMPMRREQQVYVSIIRSSAEACELLRHKFADGQVELIMTW